MRLVANAVLALAATATRLPLLPPTATRLPLSPSNNIMMMSATPDLSGLIDEALRITAESEEKRQQLVEQTVISWLPSERQRLSDELSDLLSARAAAIQTDAIALHEKGEDYSEMSATLQVLVDMTVQSKLLVRKLKAASEA